MPHTLQPASPTQPPCTHILYLHGFRSSPQSTKARQVAAAIAQHHPQVVLWCPQLPPSPQAAIAALRSGLAQWPAERMVVIGSSLGGFYATWVAQHMGCASVLLNPAVHPARDLARHIGQQQAWHNPQEAFFFRPEYIDELRALEVPTPAHPPRQLLIAAQGDEVLDWNEMVARYPQAEQWVLPGGDHALSNFPELLPRVLAFCGLGI